MTTDQLYSMLIAPLIFTLINAFGDQLKVLIRSFITYIFGNVGIQYYTATLEYDEKNNREVNEKIIAIRYYVSQKKIIANTNFIVSRKYGSEHHTYLCPQEFVTIDDVQVRFDSISKVTLRSKKPILDDFIKTCEKTIDHCDTIKKSLNVISHQYIYQQDVSESKLTFASYVFKTTKTFDTLFYHDKKKVIALLDTLKKGHISKVNLLLYGEPGCGKSSMIKCIANYTQRDVIVVKLGDINTVTDLYQLLFGSAISLSYPYSGQRSVPIDKRMYVFEDIDAETTIVHSRGSKNDETSSTSKSVPPKLYKLTLSDILNAFDGIMELTDIIMVFTTNHVEKLDPALIRPGRITLKLHMGNLIAGDMQLMIKHFYGQSVSDHYIKKINPSQMEALCHACPTLRDLKRELEFMD